MKKKVLFIINNFPPPINSGNIRVFKFAKYLNEFGWEVHVVCDGGYVNNNIYNDKSLLSEFKKKEKLKVHYIHNIIRMFRSKNYNNYSYNEFNNEEKRNENIKKRDFSILKKLYKICEKYIVPDIGLFIWNKSAYKYIVKLIKKEKIRNVITSSPIHSTQLIGLKLKRKFKNDINWIADFRDLWSMSHIFNFDFAKFRWLNYILEKRVLFTADRILFVSDSIRIETISNFNINSKIKKFYTITNGFDSEDFLKFNNYKKKRFDNNSNLKINYIGTLLGPMVNIKYIEGIECFINKFRGIFDIEFNFIGSFDKIILNKINNLNSEKIKIFPYIQHNKAIEWMINSDVLVLILNNTKEGKMGFSGKFFEYLAAGKPILALVPDGEVSNIVKKYSLGEIVNPDDEQKISNAIIKLYSKYKSGNLKVEKNDNLLKKYDRKELTKRLEKILNC